MAKAEIMGSTNDFKADQVQKVRLGADGVTFVLKDDTQVLYWIKKSEIT